MATLNKVMLIGRLTADPEAPRNMPNGGQVITVRLAVGRSRKNKETGQWENDPNPLYIDCEAFSRPDDKRDLPGVISKYLRKGNEVYLEGQLRFEMWDDKNNPGQKRSKHKLVISGLELLGGKSDGGSADSPHKPEEPRQESRGQTMFADSPARDDDPIPF